MVPAPWAGGRRSRGERHRHGPGAAHRCVPLPLDLCLTSSGRDSQADAGSPIVEQLGVAAIGKDAVSRLCRGLDEQVRVFRERPPEGRYPYLWLDGKVEKVRERGAVRQGCLVIAYGA